MCSVENLEGIVITDRDGVIILEGKPEEGVPSFASMFEGFTRSEITYICTAFTACVLSYIC